MIVDIAIVVFDELEPSILAYIEVSLREDIVQDFVVCIYFVMNPIEIVPQDL